MRPPRNLIYHDLGLQLLTVYLFLIVPFLAALLVFDRLVGERILSDVQSNDIALARAIALETNLSIEHALKTVERLASHPAVLALDTEGLGEVFRIALAARPDVNLVYRLNADGIMYYHYPAGPDSTVGDRFFVSQLLSGCAALQRAAGFRGAHFPHHPKAGGNGSDADSRGRRHIFRAGGDEHRTRKPESYPFGRPTQSAFATRYILQRITLIAAATFILIGLAFWGILSSRVITPIEKLAPVSEAIGLNQDIEPAQRQQIQKLSRRADQIGHLIRSILRMENSIAARMKEQATLLETSAAVVSSLELNVVLDRILEQVARLLNVSMIAIIALEPERGEFRVRASRGLSRRFSEQLSLQPSEPGAGKRHPIRR